MSRLALVGLVLASALVGGAASSYVAIAVAQTQPAPVPAAARSRFEHWCSKLDGVGLKAAGERGWEMVTAYTSLGGSTVVLRGTSGSEWSQLHTTLPVTPTTYCFKRALP